MISNLANFEEIDQYEKDLQAYLNLEIDTDRFTAIRLQQGTYGQRQEGVNMLRVKLPGGKVQPAQMRAIADVLEKYARHDVVHITTRQDIQIHYVPLADTPAAMRQLATTDLTTREACGNTIRNVTACPMAGVCAREHTDVTQHLEGAVQHFLRNPLNQQLPRKFKISFSGCEADCAQAMIHDLGVVAVRQEDRFGFKVLAGGGLGHKPHEAIVVEPFIEEKDLLLVMEALVSLHNRYSDRTKRAKARIKFLVDRFGPEGFIEKYREELAYVKAALAARDYPKGEWQKGSVSAPVCGSGAPREVIEQKQKGLYVFPLAIPMGNLTVNQLRGIADTLEKYRLDEVRTTQDQNLIVINVPKQVVENLREEFALLGLSQPQIGDNVVACPGTSTCRLGITSSTILAPKLSGGSSDLRIRVSGCHNGCAQPESGDIGIYGEGRRLFGKLIPHYQLYLGGNGMAGGALAIKGPSIPSARIEVVIERLQKTYHQNRLEHETFFSWARRQEPDYFKTLLADLIEVKEQDLPSVLRDHGHDEDFKVLQLGGGECAGASQVLIGINFFEAAHERDYRDALRFQRKYTESAECAITMLRLIGQAVVQIAQGSKIAVKIERLSDIATEITRLLPESSLGSNLAKFATELSYPLAEPAITLLFAEIDAWVIAAAEFCQSRDAQLVLRDALPKKQGNKSIKHATESTPAL